MHLLEHIQFDSTRKKGKIRKLVAKRILDLLEDWEKNKTGRDYFIFAHTFKTNVDIYKIFAELDNEQIDKLDEYVELLSNPKEISHKH